MTRTKQTNQKKQKFDYSAFVDAVRNEKRVEASKLSREIIVRLIDYLKVVMSANQDSAEECAQQAFMNVYEQIIQNNIRKPEYIFMYLIRACRNEYFKFVKIENRYLSNDDALNYMKEPAEQMENLIEQERLELLNECLDELDKDSRNFILYLLRYPDKSTEEICEKFGMSNANVRTKKSRLIKRLHNAYKVKSAKTMPD